MNVRYIQVPAVDPTVDPNTGLQVLGKSWNMAITADQQGSGSNSRISLENGNTVNSFGSGFKPNSVVELYTYSNPIFIGSVITDSNGDYNVTFQVPNSLAVGNHIIQAQGETFDSLLRKVNVPLTVVATGTLAKSQKKFDVFFTLNSYFLEAKARADIKAAYNSVKRKVASKSLVTVTVTGWVQPTKISPNVLWLSNNRAKAVADYLKSLGLKANYVIKAPGHDKSNIPSSRRASVVITWSNP